MYTHLAIGLYRSSQYLFFSRRLWVVRLWEGEGVGRRTEKEGVGRRTEKEGVGRRTEKEGVGRRTEKEGVRRRKEKEWVGRRKEREGGKDIKQETLNYFYTQNGFSRPRMASLDPLRWQCFIPGNLYPKPQSFRRPKYGQVNR
jgi:hypothetical protein